jgi:YggT family protein
MALRLIGDLIEIYIVILFVRIMFTWFPITPGTPVAQFEHAIGSITDPLLRRVRRVVPPVRVGGAMLDLSPIIVFVVLLILRDIL